MKVKPKILVIVGPTGSGKTALSIQLAKRFDGEVISADSRQVYRGLDIGTEKVSLEEMQGVPHHLINICDVSTTYTAESFKRDATEAIGDIIERGKLPIIAGGTFFYIDLLLGRISAPSVPVDPELRAHLEELNEETLYARLEELDPERAFSIDKSNKRRLVRALEIVDSLGSVPKGQVHEPSFNSLLIGIDVPKEELRARLRARAASALERGLVEETKQLLASGVSHDRLNEIGLEYRLVLEHLDGAISETELLKKLEEKNWQYAKRQLTWLKRDTSIQWFRSSELTSIESTVAQFLKS